MNNLENAMSRISNYNDVEKILIIKSVETEDSINSIVMKSINKSDIKSGNEDKEKLYPKIIPQLGREAKSIIKQLDPKSDLTFLRVKTTGHEVLIAPEKDYYLCVLQKLPGAEDSKKKKGK